MAKSGVTALGLAVMLALLELGSCINCYQCNSESSPACNDPFVPNQFSVDCASPESMNYNRNYLSTILPRDFSDGVPGATRFCHKIVLQTGATIRTCMDANAADLNHTCRLLQDAARANPNDLRRQIKHCSVCDKDRCNGAGSIMASLPLAAIALIASYLYSKQ